MRGITFLAVLWKCGLGAVSGNNRPALEEAWREAGAVDLIGSFSEVIDVAFRYRWAEVGSGGYCTFNFDVFTFATLLADVGGEREVFQTTAREVWNLYLKKAW